MAQSRDGWYFRVSFEKLYPEFIIDFRDASWNCGARVLELACARMPHSSTMADLNNLFGDLQGKGHIHVSYSVSSGQGASAAALGNG